jgi:two-component system, OmpR family, phosphate regulon sensor histidine kinase PhoR
MMWWWILALPVVWMTYEIAVALWLLHKLRRRVRQVQAPFGLIGALVKQGQLRRDRLERRQRRLSQLMLEMRTLGRALPDGLLVLDQDLRLLWSNAQAAALLGNSAEQRGQILQLHDARAAEWLASYATEPLLDIASASDADIRLSFRLLPFRNQKRLLIVRDVSMAMRLTQVRRDFVANVSHELRTPLTVINGYLDTFEPDELPEYSEIFEQMRHQSRRMVQIVEDLLTLSRLDHASDTPDDDVSMAPLLLHLVEDAQGISRGKHKIVLSDALPMDLVGNEKDLRSAFSNLVTNAVRYTPEGGEIRLKWLWHEDGAMFSVEDTGVGIPAQHLPRLTERFYRVSTSRSRESGGTGLGLAIVNHVLLAHQGRLEIASELGRGSVFKCILPRVRMRYRDVGI